MPRIARVVVPDIPHHVTQRGNRKQKTFFQASDYRAYLELMSEWCRYWHVEIWAYALMPNHVHLVALPSDADALARAISETHRRYTRMINFKNDWRGHLWQGRFSSCPMDESHLMAATRYIELNPVRAKLVEQPEDYPYSSSRAHLQGKDDRLVKVRPLLEMAGDWRQFLEQPENETALNALRLHERTGRPLGDDRFVARLESLTGRSLKKQKAGRPRKKIAK